MRALKWILLGIYLILLGLEFLGIGLGSWVHIVAGVCAVIAGVLFMLHR